MRRWPPEKEAALAELVSRRLTAGQIARFMPGVTRNAVIAKTNRMGIKLARADAAVAARLRQIASGKLRSTPLAQAGV